MSQQRTNNANTGGSSDGGESGGSGGGRDPIYRGVRQRKSSKKWVSEIREPKTPNRIWLGTFTKPEMAAVAYDVAALALKGKNAELNFPNSASSLPTPLSTSPRDIQAAAASAAAALGAAADALGGGAVAEDDRLVVVEEEDEVNGGGGVVNNNNNNEEFVDEDMIFDMPNILLNMAHGMMISPPRMGGFDDAGDNVNVDGGNLWNYP